MKRVDFFGCDPFGCQLRVSNLEWATFELKKAMAGENERREGEGLDSGLVVVLLNLHRQQ